MSGYSAPMRENDAVQTVRTIGRIAQMLIELRDEYTERRRDDTLQQIDRRLDDLADLHAELKQKIAAMHTAE